MVIVVSVKSKQPAEATTTTTITENIVVGRTGMLFAAVPRKGGGVWGGCCRSAWLYVQTRDLICFVCYSFSSLWWVLVWI